MPKNLEKPPNTDYISRLDEDIRNNTYPPAILVRVVFLNYLRQAYATRPIGDLKYNEDDEQTEIIIKESATLNDVAVQKRPAILITRGSMTPMNMGMNNSQNFFDVHTLTSRHIDLLTTSLGFSCISPLMLESESIASTVFGVIRYYKEDIRERGIVQIRGLRIDPPEPLEIFHSETKFEAVRTNVQAQVFTYDKWVMRPKTDAEIQDYVERTGKDPRGYNVPLNTVEEIETTVGVTGEDDG